VLSEGPCGPDSTVRGMSAAAEEVADGAIPVAAWSSTSIRWSEARSGRVPLFVPPPKVRPAARWATPPTLTHLPSLVRRPTVARARERLAFEVWRTTAATFGIRRLTDLEGRAHPWSGHLPAPSTLRPVRPTITCVLLNRDGGPRLLRAIESARGIVDEVLIVDDGSTDGSARAAAARWDVAVVDRRLDGDFAAQRNHGIERASGEWILMIDADEELEPGMAPLLHRAVRNDTADVVFVPRLNHVDERGPEPVSWPDYQGRLFRRHLRFHGRLHEQLSGWNRPVHLPLSGPYLVHRKTLLDHYRSSLLYDALDENSPYPAEMIEEMRRAVAEADGEVP
jgi:hypothetical protein